MSPPRNDRIGHSNWCTQPQDPDKATLDKQKVAHNYTCRYSLCRSFLIIAQKDFRDSFKTVEQWMFPSIVIPDKRKLTILISRLLLCWLCLKLDFFTFWNWRACQTQVASAYLVCWLPESRRFCRTLKHSTLTKAQLTEEMSATSWHHHSHRPRHDLYDEAIA